LVSGLRQDEAQKLIAARETGAPEHFPAPSIQSCGLGNAQSQIFGPLPDRKTVHTFPGSGLTPEDIARKAGLARGVLERIAEADAFRSEHLDRRTALWRASALKGERTLKRNSPLLAYIAPEDSEDIVLPPMRLSEHVAEDYRTIGLSLKEHPCAFFRRALHARGVFQAAELEEDRMANGRSIRVAGLVLNRQRPGTAKNVMFATLEDESGVANLVVWDQIFQAQRREWMTSSFMLIDGELQKANGVTHVIAKRITDLTPLLARLRDNGPAAAPLQRSRDFH
jgi:error-prone DNA polymerase